MTQRLVDMPVDPDAPDRGKFDFRGGSTVNLDMEGEQPTLRYAITRQISDKDRLERIQAYKRGRIEQGLSLRDVYFGDSSNLRADEPFLYPSRRTLGRHHGY
jgi:hypothetical protein